MLSTQLRYVFVVIPQKEVRKAKFLFVNKFDQEVVVVKHVIYAWKFTQIILVHVQCVMNFSVIDVKVHIAQSVVIFVLVVMIDKLNKCFY